MRNLKRHFAVALTLAMLVMAMAPVAVFANSEYSDEAQALYELGLYKGLSDQEFVPDLESTLDRQTGAVMLLRMFGLESEALVLSYDEAREILSQRFSDADEVAEWAVRQVAYATQQGVIAGFPGGTFGPTGLLTGRQYLALILNMLGYSEDLRERGFESSGELFYEVSQISISQELSFDQPNAIQKDLLVGISFEALKSTLADGSGTLVEKLVDTGLVSSDFAEQAGLYTPPTEPTEPAEPVLEVLEVSLSTEEGESTVTATVSNYEEGATATVALTPDEALELDVLYFEDVEIGEGGEVSYTFEFELPVGTHSVAVWVEETPSESYVFTIEAPPVPDQEIVEVKAVAEDKIVVEFAAPVEEVEEVGFDLEGPMAIEPTVTWNEEKTEAHLVSPGIFIEGTYTITVTGLELPEGDDSYTIVLSENGVASIEILSDKLIRTGDSTAEVSFVLYDSFGNDVTENSWNDVTFNLSRGEAVTTDADEGILIVDIDDGVGEPTENEEWKEYPVTPELVTLTIYADDVVGGKIATANSVLSVTELARINEVEVSDVMFEDDDETQLVIGEAEAGYVVLTAKDQFDREVDNIDLFEIVGGDEGDDAEVFYSVSDSDVKDRLTVLEESNDDGVDEIRVKFDLSLVDDSKTVTFQVISKYTGKASNVVTLKLVEAGVPHKVVLGNPSRVVAVGDTYEDLFVLPMTVYDEEGQLLSANEVADEKDLIDINEAGLDLGLVVETTGEYKGHLVAKITSPDVVEVDGALAVDDGLRTVVVSVEGSTAAPDTVTVKVEERADARTIRLAQTPASNFLYGADTEFSYDFYDQYGREMESEMLDINSEGNTATVKLTISDNEKAQLFVGGVEVGDVDGDEIVYEVDASELTDEDAVMIKALDVDGSFTLKAELYNAENDGTVSTLTRSFKVEEGVPSTLEFAIEDIGTLYTGAADIDSIYAFELEVTATDASGDTYAVPADRILDAANSSDLEVVGVEKNDAGEVMVYGVGEWTEDDTEKTAVVTLQILTDDGAVSVQTTITASTDEPEVQTVWFIDEPLEDKVGNQSQDLPDEFKIVNELDSVELGVTEVYLVTVDQYGVYTEVEADEEIELTVSNSDKANGATFSYDTDAKTISVDGVPEEDETIVLIYIQDGVTGKINVRF